jgi:ankyrin repeat protein
MNTTDLTRFPLDPTVQQYEKLARDLLADCRAYRAKAIARVKKFHPRSARMLEQREFTLADAQIVLAREHGFRTWKQFTKHIKEVIRNDSPVHQFESAADAIVSGDAATLKSLLKENPELIRARSTRVHRAMLLHYVGANGFENYRQKTPKNAVEIAKILLSAGAEVNALGDMYGRSNTLGLVATSVHPRVAGVQNELMKLLLDHGATFELSVDPNYAGGSIVNACLANGRPGAAEFLARRGATLDLEGAAGVGRLEEVESFFNSEGSLKTTATKAQLKSGFNWACEYGRTNVVRFLLPRGIKLGEIHHGETGLHWASYGGHADIVKLLLQWKAPLEIKDKRFNVTPLGWAVHGWANPPNERRGNGYYEIVALLVAEGAKVEPRWKKDKKVRADARMQAALQGTI